MRLKFTPVIQPNGSIHLHVAPEVSTLDFADAVTVAGTTIPAISTRKADTEFELQDGQSFVIAGLLDNRVTNVDNKIPWLGDIPVSYTHLDVYKRQEWHSPNFHDGLYRPLLIVWLLLLAALASARSRPNGRVLVPLIFTAFAALDALRHIPIFILIAIPVIAAALPRDAITPLQRRASSRRQLLFGTIVLLLMACLLYTSRCV